MPLVHPNSQCIVEKNLIPVQVNKLNAPYMVLLYLCFIIVGVFFFTENDLNFKGIAFYVIRF